MTHASRITLITLAVSDVERSRGFYEALGWRASGASQEDVAFFDLGWLVLSLCRSDALARDLGRKTVAAGGVTLAQNYGTPDEVDCIMATMVAAGAQCIAPARSAEWGGYVGYVGDPDGHVWEIAWNPDWPLDEAGWLQIPPPSPAP